MPEISMKGKLADGDLVLCLNLRLARSVDIAMVAKAGGYDALYVDMQHAPYSIETTATICAAALGIGITLLVRVPSHDAQWMSRVLDGGAQGVIVPDVNTPAQAEAIVAACRFPPLGKRSVMGLGPALGYRAVPLAELNPKLNAETSVIVNYPLVTGRYRPDSYLTGQKMVEVLENGLKQWGFHPSAVGATT